MAETDNRHASNLELFLDLVFVFSVTQVTSFVADHLSVSGVAQGALLGFLVWWQWTAFTWAGTAIDLQSNAGTRVIVLCMIPAMLVMAITVPQALSRQGVWFSVSYMIVQLFVLALQGRESWRAAHTRRAWLRYAPLAAIAPSVLVIGGLLRGNTRIILWAVVALLMIGSGLLAANTSGGEWSIEPTHFAERHALFVIITLGEVLVAIGATAASVGADRTLDLATLLAIVAAASVACVLWWAYFAFIPAVIERTLSETPPAERGRLARDVGSFGHFPLVFGLILYAVVAKHLVQHPGRHLASADRWLLFVAMACFIGGQLAIQFRVVRRLAPERLVALLVIAALMVVARIWSATLVVFVTAIVLGAMSLITWQRFSATERARTLQAG